MSDRSAPSPLVPPAGWLGGEDAPANRLGTGFLLAMTALAAVLRLHGLTEQSLWVDEVVSWQRVRPDAGLRLLEQLRDNVQGPLYLAVLWPLLRLADSELMLRLPAAVAGVAAVPLFGRVAERLASPRAARLAVLLLVLDPFHVWYSQEARGYAFLFLATVAAAWCWLEMARRGPDRRLAVGLAATLAAAVWSNMSGMFLWAALALSAPAVWPPDARGRLLWLAGLGGGLLAAAPWLLQAAGIWAVDRFVPGAATGEALRGGTTLAPAAVPYTFFSFLYGFSLGPSLRELHAPDRGAVLLRWAPVLVAAALPVLAAALAEIRRADRRTVLLAAWIAVPVAAMVLLAARNIKPWNARYLMVALPWVLLLVARGLVHLPRRLGPVAAALLCGLMLVSLGGHRLAARYAKADVRGAAAAIATDPRAGDPVLVPAVTNVFRYYDRRPDGVLDAFGEAPLRSADAADRFVAARLAGRDAAWVLLAREWFLDPRGLLIPALARRGTVSEVALLPGVRLLHWRRTGTGEPRDG